MHFPFESMRMLLHTGFELEEFAEKQQVIAAVIITALGVKNDPHTHSQMGLIICK